MKRLDINLVQDEATLHERYGKYYADEYKTFKDWTDSEQFQNEAEGFSTLNGRGQQHVIDKINEIVEWINKENKEEGDASIMATFLGVPETPNSP